LGGWDGQEVDCATWLHKAREQRRNNFGGRAEGAGRERNRSNGARLLQVVQERDSVIEHAIETAAFMPDSDKSRGYCLEMICADFLARANLDNQNSETLLFFDDEILDDEILQVPDTPAAANLPATDPAQGVMNRIRPRHPRLRACSVVVR
jgi:hypothetical protein